MNSALLDGSFSNMDNGFHVSNFSNQIDFKSITEESIDGIVIVNKDNIITFANNKFSRLTSINKDNILGKSLHFLEEILKNISKEVFEREHWGLLYKLNNDNRSNPNRFYRRKTDLENQILCEDSYLKIIQKYEVNIQHHKIIYFRDVTQEFNNNKAKTEFLLAAAHELKNPITNILGFSEILKNKKDNDEDSNFMAEVIYSQSVFLVKILNDLLNINQIELNAGSDFNFQTVELNSEVKVMIDQYYPPKGRNKVKFLPFETDIFVNIDTNKLKQALYNLISNAYKYSLSEVTIKVNLISRGTEVAISVIDFGIGLTFEQRTRMFQKFWRAHKASEVEGVGLGLVIVKEIIELLNGRVDIFSRQNIGTSAVIYLPTCDLQIDQTG